MKKLSCGLMLGVTLFLLMLTARGETLRALPGKTSLTEALACASDGDVIEIGAGEYNESNETFPLVINKRVTLRGTDGTVINAPAFKAAFRVEADGVILEGLAIQMRRTGLYVVGDDLTVKNCSITLADTAWRTSSCGVWMGGVRRAKFINCAFTGCSISMAGPPLSPESKNKPVLTGLFECGDDTDYFTSHTIENCTVNGRRLVYLANRANVCLNGDTGAGSVILACCRDVTLSQADVSESSMGITLAYCQNVSLRACRADRCGIFGFYLVYCDNAVIESCSTDGTNHGIDLRASHHLTVRNCTAENCEQGIFFSHVNNSRVLNCTVSDTGQGYFFAAGNHNLVMGSSAERCENGFNVQKENDMLITDCSMDGNTTCAVRLDGSPTIFSNNTLTGNWVGVMAYGNAEFTLTGNRFENSGSCGLYLRDINFSRVTGNVFSNSAESSVQAHGVISGTMLDCNEVDVPISTEE